MPLHHIGLTVSDLEAAKAAFLTALAPLHYEVVLTFPNVVGLGAKHVPDFWLTACSAEGPDKKVPSKGIHLAFAAPNREVVDQFHAAALKAGFKDNGPPGPRPNYTPTYYAAFVFDAEGNNIEVVHM